MPPPTMAAEWARTCTHFGPLVGIGGPVALLCVDCAESYARQQVEAFREQVIAWLDNEDRYGDPDDLYTGRRHRVAAIRQLKP